MSMYSLCVSVSPLDLDWGRWGLGGGGGPEQRAGLVSLVFIYVGGGWGDGGGVSSFSVNESKKIET